MSQSALRAGALRLESFDPAPAAAPAPARPARAELEREIARARSEGHARGFEEGAAAALAREEAETRALLAGLAEHLADRALTERAARSALERRIGPLLAALLGALAPALAERGLGPLIEARIRAILARMPDARPVLRVPPARVEELRALLGGEGIGAPALRILADPDLSGLSCEIDWADGIDAIDPGAAAAEVTAALGELLDTGANGVPRAAAAGG